MSDKQSGEPSMPHLERLLDELKIPNPLIPVSPKNQGRYEPTIKSDRDLLFTALSDLASHNSQMLAELQPVQQAAPGRYNATLKRKTFLETLLHTDTYSSPEDAKAALNSLLTTQDTTIREILDSQGGKHRQTLESIIAKIGKYGPLPSR